MQEKNYGQQCGNLRKSCGTPKQYPMPVTHGAQSALFQQLEAKNSKLEENSGVKTLPSYVNILAELNKIDQFLPNIAKF